MAELETKRLSDQMREYLDQNPEFAVRNANLWNLGMFENDPTIRYLMGEKDFRAAGSPVAPQGYTRPFLREDWAGSWRNRADLAEIAYRMEEITDPDASGDPRTGTRDTKFHEAGGHSAMDVFQWADESLWNDVTFDDPVSGKEMLVIDVVKPWSGDFRGRTTKRVWSLPIEHDMLYADDPRPGYRKRVGRDYLPADISDEVREQYRQRALNMKKALNDVAPKFLSQNVQGSQELFPSPELDDRAQPYKPGFWAVDYDPTQARWQDTESELGGYGADVRAPPEKIGGTGYQQGLIPSDEPGMADFRGFAGPTGYQQWDVGADYVPGISSVMPDIRSRDLYTPPGPPGEAAFRQSQAVPSTLQAGNGLISQPVTTGLIEQPTGAAQSTFDYGRALLEEELQRSIRREETEPPYDPAAELQGLLRAEQTEPTFQQIEPGYQPRVIPGHVPFQDLPQGGVWPEPPKKEGGFLSSAGGMLGRGLTSMISTAEAAPPIEDKLYDALSSAEFRGTTPDFIRTKAKATPGGSTAYGPVQITRTLLSEKKGKLNLTAKEDNYVDRFLEQGKKFAEFGNEPNKSGYDTKYDYGGVGDLTSQKDQKLYKSVAKKLIKLLWDEKGQDMEKFIGRWRGVPRKQDVDYYKAFDKAI